MKSVAREVKVLSKARDALELDFKAVLARHAREVDVASTARREATKAQAARAAAEAEMQHIKLTASAAAQRLMAQVRARTAVTVFLCNCGTLSLTVLNFVEDYHVNRREVNLFSFKL